MNNLKRTITLQNGKRLVNGIPINRDVDFGIIFEKNSHLQLAKENLQIPPKDVEFYPGWDRDAIHCTLGNGAVVGMTHAQGPAFAASAVERLVRSGASHIVRIGTCGSLSPEVPTWSVVLASAAIRSEGTTDAYIAKEFPAIADIPFHQELFQSLKEHSGLPCFSGIVLTNCARYKEDPVKMAAFAEAGAIAVDMETSALLIVTQLYGVAGASIGIAMDSPVDKKDAQATKDLNGVSSFHGVTDHGRYEKVVPDMVQKIIRSVNDVFKEYAL